MSFNLKLCLRLLLFFLLLIVSFPVNAALNTYSFEQSGFIEVDESAGFVDIVMLKNVTVAGGSRSATLTIGADGDSAVYGKDYEFTDDGDNVRTIFWDYEDDDNKVITLKIIDNQSINDDKIISLNFKDYGAKDDGVSQVIVIHDDDNDIAEKIEGVEIVSGDKQRYTVEGEFENLVVKVLFADGDPIIEVPVEWVISEGPGRLETTSSATNTEGISSNYFTTSTTQTTRITATVKISELTAADSATGRRLQARALQEDPSVEFVMNPNLAELEGLHNNEKAVAQVLDNACETIKSQDGEASAGQLDLEKTCDDILFGDGDAAAKLRLLAPDEVTVQGTAIIETGNLQIMNVSSRLNALRSGAGVSVSGLRVRYADLVLPQVLVNSMFGLGGTQTAQGGGGNSLLNSQWSGFINGEVSFGEKDGSLNEIGFDFRSSGLTAGIDYRVSNEVVVGMAVGYGSNSSDFDEAAGGLEMQGVHLTAYGTYFSKSQFYIDGLLRFGWNDFDTQRRVNDDDSQMVKGQTAGSDYSISIDSGFDISRGGWTLGPYGRLALTRADIDGYTETAAKLDAEGFGSILSIHDQTVDSMTTALGGQVTYAISTKNGVYLPQFRFEWEREYNDDSRMINAQFVYDPTSTVFGISTDSPDRSYFNVGLGFSAVGTHGRSGFLYYETRVNQQDVEQHWIKGGFRQEF